MFFQKVIKGINGISQDQAQHMLDTGILCNWWRNAGEISIEEKKMQLVDENIGLHLNFYEEPLPSGHPFAHLGRTYGDVSPFISTTAGTIEREWRTSENMLHSAFLTALDFATNGFTDTGFMFYAYVLTIGKKAVALEQFAEEVRDLHIYTDYLPYQNEGEIMAKIIIPSVQIETAHMFNGPDVMDQLDRGITPIPTLILDNMSYLKPESFSNIKDFLI